MKAHTPKCELKLNFLVGPGLYLLHPHSMLGKVLLQLDLITTFVLKDDINVIEV